MEQKSKTIGTTTYLVTQMDAISALKIQAKIIKIIGPGIFSLANTKTSAAEKMKEIIPHLMEKFDDEVVVNLVLSLFEKNVFYQDGQHPKVVDFGTHFTGKIMEMWKVAGFILEANFSMGELIESSLPTTKEEGLTQGS